MKLDTSNANTTTRTTPQPPLKHNLYSASKVPCGVTQNMRCLEEEYEVGLVMARLQVACHITQYTKGLVRI